MNNLKREFQENISLLNISEIESDEEKNKENDDILENEKLKKFLIDSAKKFNLNYIERINNNTKEDDKHLSNEMFDNEENDIVNYNDLNFTMIEKVFKIISSITNK